MTDLDPKHTFDTFVVGPANRLASAAARRAAGSPGTSYNPLFIYSASGLGKTHILAAIAHQSRKGNNRVDLLYQTLESYLDDLASALETGNREDLREKYRSLDLLLLDDVQFLAGQAEAQEMLLRTLDTLTASGSQIVLASDRPPADINGLDARLVSRFSGGLIVDIGAPEYETRVAILRRKSEERGHTLEPGVAEALARYPLKNVRELGGALNRVLAIQDLEDRTVTADEIPGIMGGTGGNGAGGSEPDDFSSFLDEVSAELADAVVQQEEPWRQGLREMAEAAEREGYSAARLHSALEADSEPEDWEGLLDEFQADVTRLREIDAELDRLENPWTEAARSLLRDPDRLEDAESLLNSVRERQRPFRSLGPGPELVGISDRVPQLAYKAAEQLVVAERPRYNPFYVWARDEQGPNALLGAAGRTFRELRPDARMAVAAVSDFAEDFIRALSDGVAGAWRERWWTVDLLLVHGVQTLSDTERAQDEFFHLFEALKRRGARVMIAADRPPSEIDTIDERLRSRFEGGLVLELENARVTQSDAVLTLYEPHELTDDWELVEPAPEEVAEAETAEEAEEREDGGAGEEEAEAAAGAARGWYPSPEKVVWRWPHLDDRMVDDPD
jgi:chromosomal replication initiation ATPase DnaA